VLVTSERLNIDLDRKKILHAIGYCNDSEPSSNISTLVEEYIENAHQLIVPMHSYIIKNVEAIHGPLAIIDDSIIFKSEVTAHLLERCCMVAIFLVTIGSHLEETAAQLADDGLILQSYVLDAIGSEAVEKVADYVHYMTNKMAFDDGFVSSRRFSPGYCDWDISQQKILFQAVSGDSIGVYLTEECIMMPQKSISGIIGIGPPEGGLENYNPCVTCDKNRCVGRRLD
jgi:hypothetical protein